jgi:hypothetical protein
MRLRLGNLLRRREASVTSQRNSAGEDDSTRDFVFDFENGKDSTTVLPSCSLLEPCFFWAAARVSLQRDPERAATVISSPVGLVPTNALVVI